jgi:hypothetical protein
MANTVGRSVARSFLASPAHRSFAICANSKNERRDTVGFKYAGTNGLPTPPAHSYECLKPANVGSFPRENERYIPDLIHKRT